MEDVQQGGDQCEDRMGKQLNRLARIIEVTFALSSDVKLDSLLQKIVDSARKEMLDTRTFIEPADPCLYSPCWYAAP